jgi:hypothetical protein
MATTLKEREPQQRYVLRLVRELLSLETSLRRGRSPWSMDETSSRLLLIDRLLTQPLTELESIGLPVPLPRAAVIIDARLRALRP